jgi:hypothetical protein
MRIHEKKFGVGSSEFGVRSSELGVRSWEYGVRSKERKTTETPDLRYGTRQTTRTCLNGRQGVTEKIMYHK